MMANTLLGKLFGKASQTSAQEMTDIVFDLEGSLVPNDYPFALWTEIVRTLEWLKEEQNVGILPLRGSASGESTLLSKRSKLILRVPAARGVQTNRLTGQQLKIGDSLLVVGKSRERELQPATTLHSYMVESNLGEVEFIADMQKKLRKMNISCNLICDKYKKISGSQAELSGFGLVLHDLSPEASLQIQRAGLGGARHYGCGIFVPFKAISGLE
jgi:CRISPR-associated protein Cas6